MPQNDPILYSPALETREDEEAKTNEEMQETFQDILNITAEDEGRAIRSVHAKSHGILSGTLEILPDLPIEYAQGMFAQPGRHAALARISTNPGDILHDKIGLPRGFALKVLDVEGTRLPGSDGSVQDFTMINAPAFTAENGKDFLRNLKLLAKTTDRAEWAKKGLSTVLRGAEKLLETVGLESGTLQSMGGAPNLHPLGETYYTMTPYRYGDYVAKLQIVPVSDNLISLTGEIIDASDRHDALREEVAEAMKTADGVWELRVQLLRDKDSMPIEDATVVWHEELSPFVAVARLTVPAQTGWSEAKAARVDDCMHFSPWNGLEAHRPMGRINRIRRDSYDLSARFRARVNQCPMHEPTAAELEALV